MRLYLVSLFVLTSSFISEAHSKSAFSTYGDFAQFATPLASSIISYDKEDSEGFIQLSKSVGITVASTFALKYSLRCTDLDKRPKGGGYSFPSGHTSLSFAGASYLHHRYGIKYGFPAYLIASSVGLSRVQGKYHHTRDIIGGAILAYAVSYFTVKSYSENGLTAAFYADKNAYQFTAGFNF